MNSILVFDPGESTGWCFRDREGNLTGGTIKKNHVDVAQKILETCPDIIVMERFNLYPQMAKSLAWNSFYPCEVIGVIRYLAMDNNIILVEQAPSIKKYAGGFVDDWYKLKEVSERVTEHTKDAYLHYRYFLRNGAQKFQAVQ